MTNGRTRAEDAVRGIQPLSGARIVRRLQGGKTSDLWLLEQETGKLVLRIDREIIASLSLDRQREETVTRVTGDAGIGPELIYSDPGNGLQVVGFLDQPAWSMRDARTTGNLRQLAMTLARLHRLSVPVAGFDPLASAEHYARIVGDELAWELASEITDYDGFLKSAPGDRVLCHNDLVHSNILGRDPVMLIDWEFAAMGDAMFDLATVIQHHELDAVAREEFIRRYQDEGGAVDSGRLQICCALYDSLAALWYSALNAEYVGNPPFLAELESALIRRRSSRTAVAL